MAGTTPGSAARPSTPLAAAPAAHAEPVRPAAPVHAPVPPTTSTPRFESVTPISAGGLSPQRRAEVQREIRDHLLLHFTDWSVYEDQEVPVYVRGDGCHVIDHHGRRVIDGLSGLFCTNLGHSYGAEIGAAGAAQLAELVYTPSWYVTHPSSADLAARLAEKAAPLGLTRTFLTSGGGEAVESAWKLARQWHAANGEPQRRKAISRRVAYHGTHLGALSFTGIPETRWPFEPLGVPTHFVSNTNAYRHPAGHDEDAFTAALLAEMEDAIYLQGPDQVAMVIAEPVQNSGGCFTPPRGYWAGLREICDRHGILLVADEVITAFGRVGEWFGSIRYDARPDMLTFAKGATAGHAPLGGVLVSEKVAEPFLKGEMFMHGLTFGGHPLATAIAGAAHDGLRARGRDRERPRERGLLRGAAPRAHPRPARGRRPRRRLLLGRRAREGPRDQADLRGRRGRLAAPPGAVGADGRARPALPPRRPRRPGHPALAAARGRP